MLGVLLGGKAKMAIYLALALAVASAVAYHYWKVNGLTEELSVTRIDLVTSQANEAKLQGAVDELQQSQLILTQQREIDQAKLDQLSTDYRASRRKVGELRQMLSEHDLGHLMLNKPGLLETRMNRATRRLGTEFEELTGGQDE